MKKILKKWAALGLAVLLVWSSWITVYAASADNEIMPLYNTNISVDSIPNLSSTGRLTVTNTYGVNDSRVTQVVITSYVEKRSLLLFWDRVDIGTTNDEWVAYGGNGDFAKTFSAQMPGSGTYRVTTTFDVYSGTTLLDSISGTSKLSY